MKIRKPVNNKTIKKQCQALKLDGSRCQAVTLPGSNFCFFHDPTMKETRQAGRSLGGRQTQMKTLDPASPDVNIKDCQDVARLLSETINQVRKGVLDPRVANSVGYLANVLIRAAEQGETERRLNELESIVKTSRTYPDANLDMMVTNL